MQEALVNRFLGASVINFCWLMTACNLSPSADLYSESYPGFAAIAQFDGGGTAQESYLNLVEVERRILRISGVIADQVAGEYQLLVVAGDEQDLARGSNSCACSSSRDGLNGAALGNYRSETIFLSQATSNVALSIDYRARPNEEPVWRTWTDQSCVEIHYAEDGCVLSMPMSIERRLAE